MSEVVKKRALSEIDKNRLDEECVNFPVDYETWAIKLANARADLEEAENVLEIAKAETDLKVRDRSYVWKTDKVTESTIKSAVTLDPKVKDAEKEVREAKKLLDFTVAKVNALDRKKSMLEKIVSLRLASYYIEPQIPRGADELRSNIQDAKRKKLYKRMREEDAVVEGD